MRLNPKYIQVFGDAIIPVLGFFLWDWSLYFILLFYFLDLVTKEILLHFKSKKIIQHHILNYQTNYQNEQKNWFKFGLISLLLLVFTTIIIQFSMNFIQVNFNSLKEIVSFLSYKDMGIEQGYILIPLIIFIGYSQYKMEFLTPAIYSKINIHQLWKSHVQTMLILLGFVAFGFGLLHFIILPEWIIVISIVVISTLYQIISIKQKNA
jgi:hypothetical protein